MPGIAVFRVVVFFGRMIVITINDINGFMIMFVPSGAPLVLLPLLYIIEVVSYLIRPLALVVRICVNLFCGHLLLVLRGLARAVVVGIILLELGVAIVQGYVYSMILIL